MANSNLRIKTILWEFLYGDLCQIFVSKKYWGNFLIVFYVNLLIFWYFSVARGDLVIEFHQIFIFTFLILLVLLAESEARWFATLYWNEYRSWLTWSTSMGWFGLAWVSFWFIYFAIKDMHFNLYISQDWQMENILHLRVKSIHWLYKPWWNFCLTCI